MTGEREIIGAVNLTLTPQITFVPSFRGLLAKASLLSLVVLSQRS